MSATFKVGETYSTRNTGSFTILARTAKRITFRIYGELRQRGILDDGEGEYCFPHGRYSMAQTINANRPAAHEAE